MDAVYSKSFERNLLDHINNCFIEKSEESIIKALDWMSSVGDFKSAIVCWITEGNGPSFSKVINHSYNSDWLKIYTENNFIDCDPVIQHSFNSSIAYTWSSAIAGSTLSEQASKEFMTAASDFSLSSGYAAGFAPAIQNTRTVISSIATKKENAPLELIYALQTLTPTFSALSEKESNQSVKLSSREIEILKWMKDGKTVWETSRIMAISESTVKFHLKNIYHKLGVCSKAHAVAVGIRNGLIF
jgi:DNA-binding CsgD family transcriptional regulator